MHVVIGATAVLYADVLFCIVLSPSLLTCSDTPGAAVEAELPVNNMQGKLVTVRMVVMAPGAFTDARLAELSTVSVWHAELDADDWLTCAVLAWLLCQTCQSCLLQTGLVGRRCSSWRLGEISCTAS